MREREERVDEKDLELRKKSAEQIEQLLEMGKAAMNAPKFSRMTEPVQLTPEELEGRIQKLYTLREMAHQFLLSQWGVDNQDAQAGDYIDDAISLDKYLDKRFPETSLESPTVEGG